MFDNRKIAETFCPSEQIVLYPGDCMELLAGVPDESLQLVVTSPPYNIGKEYEKRLKLETYIEQQVAVIRECVPCLSPQGSICWQVGNYVDNGAIIAKGPKGGKHSCNLLGKNAGNMDEFAWRIQ